MNKNSKIQENFTNDDVLKELDSYMVTPPSSETMLTSEFFIEKNTPLFKPEQSTTTTTTMSTSFLSFAGSTMFPEATEPTTTQMQQLNTSTSQLPLEYYFGGEEMLVTQPQEQTVTIPKSLYDFYLEAISKTTQEQCSTLLTSASKSSSSLHKKVGKQKSHHACPLCGSLFSRKFNLTVHMSTHQENRDRPFKCKDCEKTYLRKTDLRRHCSQKFHEALNL